MYTLHQRSSDTPFLHFGCSQLGALGVSLTVTYLFANWLWKKLDPHAEEKRQAQACSLLLALAAELSLALLVYILTNSVSKSL